MLATAYRRQLSAGRTGMNLDANPVVALSKLRRDSRLAIQGKRLLDLELVDLYGAQQAGQELRSRQPTPSRQNPPPT